MLRYFRRRKRRRALESIEKAADTQLRAAKLVSVKRAG